MKNILKLALISFFVLGFFVMGLSFLIPSTSRVSRAMDFEAESDSVMNLAGNLQRWQEWNLLLKDEQWKEMKSSAHHIKSSVWNIELVYKNDSVVKTQWVNHSGQLVESGIELHPSSNGYTVVQWYFEFKVKWYPWEKFASILFDRQVGPTMERSLDKMKTLVETQQ